MTLKLKPRKIVGINYSKFITLPKMWIDYHKLDRNDFVSVEVSDDEEGRYLILKPLERDGKNEGGRVEEIPESKN